MNNEKPTISVAKIVEAVDSNIGLVPFYDGKGCFIYGQDCVVFDLMALFEAVGVHVINDFDWTAPKTSLKRTEYKHG